MLVIDDDVWWRIDLSKLGFLYPDKINGFPSDDFPLILVITTIDHNLTGFLVDDGSSCNILYSNKIDLIGIQQAGLNLYGGGDLLAFNDSITHSRGVVDLTG